VRFEIRGGVAQLQCHGPPSPSVSEVVDTRLRADSGPAQLPAGQRACSGAVGNSREGTLGRWRTLRPVTRITSFARTARNRSMRSRFRVPQRGTEDSSALTAGCSSLPNALGVRARAACLLVALSL